MALWKEPAATATPTAVPPLKDHTRDLPRDHSPRESDASTVTSMNQDAARRARQGSEARESLIAADLTIEGKIEGSGHVRIAGAFKGDVNVQGNLTIDAGARLNGQVRANTVIVGGELHGNIDAASRVELLETGLVEGDVKAASLTVAAGSRMRGQVEFGWDEKSAKSYGGKVDLKTS